MPNPILITMAALASASFFIWVYLYFFHGDFWRGTESLPNPDPLDQWPRILAVIPARNEAEAIAATIRSHAGHGYPGDFSVILVDDQSSDATGAIAAQAAADSGLDLTLLQGTALPGGWTGKLWALRNGLAVAKSRAPAAEYILLCDADIAFSPGVLQKLTAHAVRKDVALASLMAKLDARGVWGGLLIPAFIYFFQKLYPFPKVNDPKSRIAGAAGGCMLIRAPDLWAIDGVERIRGGLIDDCALAAELKGVRGGAAPTRKIWLGLTAEVTSQRDNRSLSSIWTMVARTAYTQLGQSPLALIGATLGMALTYLAPPTCALIGLGLMLASMLTSEPALLASGGITMPSALAFYLMTDSYRPTLRRLYGKPWLAMLTLPIAAVLYMAMALDSARRHWQGRGGAWKGRVYPRPG